MDSSTKHDTWKGWLTIADGLSRIEFGDKPKACLRGGVVKERKMFCFGVQSCLYSCVGGRRRGGV
jgi:hypothetical protein